MTLNELSATSLGLSKARIEALTDGVFAVAMTLLVLDIKVPIVEQAVSEGLPHSLLALWPRFLSYAISFIMLGIYWVGHHNQFHMIRRTDRALLWINILFMMGVSLLPFSTALLSQYANEPSAIIVYGVNLIIVGLVLFWHWRHATFGHRLVDDDLDPSIVSLAARRILVGPALFLIAIGVSYFSVWASLAIYILTPLFYVFPGSIDRQWRTW